MEEMELNYWRKWSSITVGKQLIMSCKAFKASFSSSQNKIKNTVNRETQKKKEWRKCDLD